MTTRIPPFSRMLAGAHNGLRANPTIEGARIYGALVDLATAHRLSPGGVNLGAASLRATRPVKVRGGGRRAR